MVVKRRGGVYKGLVEVGERELQIFQMYRPVDVGGRESQILRMYRPVEVMRRKSQSLPM